jgi:hypothetical protein
MRPLHPFAMLTSFLDLSNGCCATNIRAISHCPLVAVIRVYRDSLKPTRPLLYTPTTGKTTSDTSYTFTFRGKPCVCRVWVVGEIEVVNSIHDFESILKISIKASISKNSISLLVSKYVPQLPTSAVNGSGTPIKFTCK